MALTGDNGSTCRETRASATLSTTNPTWTVLGLNLILGGERPVTDRLALYLPTDRLPSDGTAVISHARSTTQAQVPWPLYVMPHSILKRTTATCSNTLLF
jgi:hypothetical protein